ncbi:V/A-type H+-transporting ATPase subunit D [Desulfurobacterium pacificum]|uniref:V/A-type H+-transporting ATPase subunit D n=1 Tax=Desulfurobacterium pacificum TaxID=240166 RepID=A0ABY1NE57_9BACT|nr:V-type ATP synthase subunit D [Desulfurobacterium pacificum]SMP07454.1 V/A-type H+-transporting ATPase subunit D [Desulfurobacterium pacificum]
MIKSRTELLKLKEEIKFLEDGKAIFEEKRNILLKEVMAIVDEIEEKRKRLNAKVLEGYKTLSKAIMEVGEGRLLKESSGGGKIVLSVAEQVFAGVVVPKVSFEFEKEVVVERGEGIFSKLSERIFREVVELILEIAELEMKGWRLAEEIKKTTVRINAIENFYLPDYREKAKKIEEELEESERNAIALLKSWRLSYAR